MPRPVLSALGKLHEDVEQVRFAVQSASLELQLQRRILQSILGLEAVLLAIAGMGGSPVPSPEQVAIAHFVVGRAALELGSLGTLEAHLIGEHGIRSGPCVYRNQLYPSRRKIWVVCRLCDDLGPEMNQGSPGSLELDPR
jgi:hypothetical protein